MGHNKLIERRQNQNVTDFNKDLNFAAASCTLNIHSTLLSLPVIFQRVGELFTSASLNKKHSLEICGA